MPGGSPEASKPLVRVGQETVLFDNAVEAVREDRSHNLVDAVLQTNGTISAHIDRVARLEKVPDQAPFPVRGHVHRLREHLIDCFEHHLSKTGGGIFQALTRQAIRSTVDVGW